MTTEEIKEIIQILMESGVAELEVQRGENRVRVRRSVAAQEIQVGGLSQPSSAGLPVMASTPSSAPPKAEENLPVVKAPIVGTFYECPSPGAAAFVKPGDTVQPGQVLCIIESMKLMNEIEAEASGVIVAKLVPNGKPVEYGEALFTYRPL
ncbi:MAG: acetyl-CoA carboxylase biotin carboxyl carrier protein [Candidatus Solibacter usitatus]|nr:acetyl-CoA carboxylase biotin carboxyl carrier protein [Candidatus Solibacter usitatus]